MLSISNISITDTLSWFKSREMEVSFLVPTQVALEKSIIDATKVFREFLSRRNIHNFENQNQGTDNKKIIDTLLISNNKIYETKTSLYRPQTKEGDPRIWIYELINYASEGDLLAFLESDKKIVVVNCSNSNLNEIENKLKNIVLSSFHSSTATTELLEKLTNISSRGFIKSLRSGDTGVGYTLETLLGISENSSKNPDYKGIEIKSSRRRNTKGTLFSMVPNWNLSNIKSPDELVLKRGRANPDWNGLKTLFHTIQGNKKNNWGLKLSIEDEFIYQTYENEYDVCWLIEDFQERISTKHKETFWIEVDSKGDKDQEEFHYKKVIHSGDIDTSVIPILIEDGIISLDYLLWERGDGWKNYTKKSGFDFLWKIKNKDKDLLFKFIKTYDLT